MASPETLIVPARIARTGVLSYRNADGTERRELRLPEEVFHPDSLATLEGVPVIDIVDHTALVTSDSYGAVARGHAAKATRDGQYIAADLHIYDGATLDALERGARADVSAGYVSKLDMTAGIYEGEPYDCVQRQIRFNHVALCPPGRGRSGTGVGVRLDAHRRHADLVNRMTALRATFDRDLAGIVVRYDAPEPLNYVVEPTNEVACACRVRVNPATGKLEKTGVCERTRDGGVIDSPHGPRRVSASVFNADARLFEAATVAAAKLRTVRSDAFTEITRAAANMRRR